MLLLYYEKCLHFLGPSDFHDFLLGKHKARDNTSREKNIGTLGYFVKYNGILQEGVGNIVGSKYRNAQWSKEEVGGNP